jgi:hypothetical protein
MSENDEARVFVSDVDGPEAFVGFFEDDGETGYLYVSDRRLKKVVRHLQIYNDSRAVAPEESDISVVWSANGKKCAVIIFGGIRGIIDMERGIEGRSFMRDRLSPPIQDQQWLRGFERHIVQ